MNEIKDFIEKHFKGEVETVPLKHCEEGAMPFSIFAITVDVAQLVDIL